MTDEELGMVAGVIKDHMASLMARIRDLENTLSKFVPPADGKDGRDGRDGKDGEDGTSLADLMIDHEGALIATFSDGRMKSMGVVKGADGADGKDGVDGQDGADGASVADFMIDRSGALIVTLDDGRMKSLGVIVGRDGADGKDGADGIDGKDGADGKDGLSLDSFEMEYLEETHEIRIKAECAGRIKEVRYPAGGIKYGGYWRDGVKAKAGEAFTCGGSLWIATHETTAKPSAQSADWVLAARAGKDGERGPRGGASNDGPVTLATADKYGPPAAPGVGSSGKR